VYDTWIIIISLSLSSEWRAIVTSLPAITRNTGCVLLGKQLFHLYLIKLGKQARVFFRRITARHVGHLSSDILSTILDTYREEAAPTNLSPTYYPTLTLTSTCFPFFPAPIVYRCSVILFFVGGSPPSFTVRKPNMSPAPFAHGTPPERETVYHSPAAHDISAHLSRPIYTQSHYRRPSGVRLERESETLSCMSGVNNYFHSGMAAPASRISGCSVELVKTIYMFVAHVAFAHRATISLCLSLSMPASPEIQVLRGTVVAGVTTTATNDSFMSAASFMMPPAAAAAMTTAAASVSPHSASPSLFGRPLPPRPLCPRHVSDLHFSNSAIPELSAVSVAPSESGEAVGAAASPLILPLLPEAVADTQPCSSQVAWAVSISGEASPVSRPICSRRMLMGGVHKSLDHDTTVPPTVITFLREARISLAPIDDPSSIDEQCESPAAVSFESNECASRTSSLHRVPTWPSPAVGAGPQTPLIPCQAEATETPSRVPKNVDEVLPAPASAW
jgi:hypothetical protein